ncbi:MAG: N-acetylmuramic acid 6-phosphate etherase [Cyanobacteria bacterium P01_H01_bin.15]
MPNLDISERGHLTTEQNNPRSTELDQLSSVELVTLFNEEDQFTLQAIANAKESIAAAIDASAQAIQQGGRLFYVGAGTSGRLGVLDAAECPPTFCTPPELVQGIIAGGAPALLRSSEKLEDERSAGAAAIAERQIDGKDIVIGITAGGTTPYVLGALGAAQARQATTVAMSCVPAEQAPIAADIDIRIVTGPELLAGSTRLKAGTATKMALNILSTGTMVRIGKVYGNRMVDVAVTNSKLYDRAVRILEDLTQLPRVDAATLLEKSECRVKLALLMHWSGLSANEGEALLTQANGDLRAALNDATS